MSNSKKVWLICGAVLLLVVVGVSSYALGSSSTFPTQTSQEMNGDLPLVEMENSGLPQNQESNEAQGIPFSTYTNDQEGYSFSYPANWKLGVGDNQVCLASDQRYVDFYCYGQTGVDTPERGFKTIQLGKDMYINVEGLPREEALKMESGRGALPLVGEEFLTINGLPAYRAVRQLRSGDAYFGDSFKGPTRTDIEYTYLKDGSLYRLWFELDDDNPDEMTKLFDQVAKSFRINP